MYISLDWIQEFVSLPKKASVQEISDLLTAHTVEVEKATKQGASFDKVVVGKVLSVAKHPNADRLRVAQVDVKEEELTIVCGAPNLEAGQMVAVSLVGAKLPNGVEIKESEIRGQKSSGMICAEDELGLGTNHEGIMVLDKKAKVGQPFAEYLGLDDTVLEIDNKSLSNRGDLWGQYGLARELSALYNIPLQPYLKGESLLPGEEDKLPKLDVKVEEKKLCPRYMAIKVDGVEVKPSSQAIQKRLLAVGLKPINNIVDISNYVMWELGQPMHAFDAAKAPEIIVRLAKKGEEIMTLDGKAKELEPSMLVIANAKEAIAVAGVMGGQDSAISADTVSIIFEAANFEPASIRRTSEAIASRTESSVRFEKGLDPRDCETALKRALELLKESCPTMEIASRVTDISHYDESVKQVKMSYSWIETKLGQTIPQEQIKDILEKLGFVVAEEADELVIDIPSWRSVKDVSIAEDVLEEIARIYGYDKIESRFPKVELSLPPVMEDRRLEDQVKDVLCRDAGLSEAYNYSFVGEAVLKKAGFDPAKHLKLANPLSQQLAFLRQNLLLGLLASVKANQFNYEEVGLFEVGRVFIDLPGKYNASPEKDSGYLPHQGKKVGIIFSSAKEDCFARVKGVVALLCRQLLEEEPRFLSAEDAPLWAASGAYANINIGEGNIGYVAPIDGKAAAESGLKKGAAYAEISFDDLLGASLQAPLRRYHGLPKFPAVSRDLAFVIDEEIEYNDISQELQPSGGLVAKIELFDVYRGEELGEGKKSLAFHIWYQSPERTLTSQEVEEAEKVMIQRMSERFAAKVRSI